MLRIVITIFILTISLFGNEKFTNLNMRKYSNLILNNKQKVFTLSEFVKSLFSIKERDEFETKTKYDERVSKILGDGIFFIYKIINDVKYNIDKKEMKFGTLLQGSNIWENEKPSRKLYNKGYTGVVLNLDFNNNAFPIVEKMKSIGSKYSFPYAYVKMSVNDAKKLKNKNNTFFQIIAVKATPDDILKRSIRNSRGSVNGKPYLDLWLEVPVTIVGTSIVSLNPKKIIFAFGIDK